MWARHLLAAPRAYDAALLRRPRVVKAATGGVLAFLGDYNAQRLEMCRTPEPLPPTTALSEASTFDWWRSLAFTSMSTFWTGPVNHWWYELLERRLPQVGGGWRVVLSKVAASQLLANPFLYLPTFYLWTGLVLGRSLPETVSKARREYWEVLRACWLVLGTANVFMFAVVPMRWQASFMAVATFCYNNVLSIIANRDRVLLRRQSSTRASPCTTSSP
jgi:hypothetical protein